MASLKTLCAVTLMAAWASAPAVAQLAHEPVTVEAVQRAVDGFIRPAFDRFANDADGTAAAIGDLCAQPGEAQLEAARDAFDTSALSFGRVEFIRIGPLVEDNRLERLLFWPDRRGIALRQVQAAIVEEAPDVTDDANLKGKSVALQGFTALEYLLYGTGADKLAAGEAEHRCGFAHAVAQNIASVADTIAAAWEDPDGIADAWAHPGPDNVQFRDREESLGELVSITAHAFELIRDQRLLPIVPEEGTANPKSALFWRAGLTFPMVAANLDGLRAYFDAVDFASVLPEDEAWLAGSAQFEFENAERTLRTLSMPVEDVVESEELREGLEYLTIVTRSLHILFGQQISAALGLTTGFSSLDGD